MPFSTGNTADLVDAIVIGAGLTGLSCAHTLRQRGLRVLLLEAGKQVGGVVGTMEAGGFLFESGPNTVPASALHLRAAAESLGIANQLVTSKPEAKRRFLFQDGGLHALPSGPGSFLKTPLLSRRAKRRVMGEPFRKYVPPPKGAPEPTFEAFLTERIGSEATRTLAGAFVRGVYAAEIEDLGSTSAFPRLTALCAEHGGLVRGMIARGRAARKARKDGTAVEAPGPRTSPTDLISFTGGFGVLTDAYRRSLKDSVSLSTPIQEIDRGPGGWRAVLESGEALSCRELVLAVPAPAASPLLAMCAPERLDTSALDRIQHAAVTAVHLGLEGAPLPPGFGYLVPPDEAARRDPRTPRVLGTLFVSNIFGGRAPSGTSSITAMFRGGDVADLVGDDLVDRAVVELEKALIGYEAVTPGAPERKTRPRVVASRVQRWTNVIPRYAPGHAAEMTKLVASLERALPGLHLAGSYLGGVSVDDRIRVGKETAERIAERLAHLSELRGGARDKRAPEGAAEPGAVGSDRGAAS
ncbi:Protoporphyrinogen oxidase [Planctomycetes bacterium Poly30]|uniref:Coproporphyrinogen III oxidase n=1 Tax=Saltatorellus ferox TaxID=2528018 RepID=A0A518F0Q7_9BACT|nr:Protoporphyrinogen oxidase [Planctomycetes bacterium Poly30]